MCHQQADADRQQREPNEIGSDRHGVEHLGHLRLEQPGGRREREHDRGHRCNEQRRHGRHHHRQGKVAAHEVCEDVRERAARTDGDREDDQRDQRLRLEHGDERQRSRWQEHDLQQRRDGQAPRFLQDLPDGGEAEVQAHGDHENDHRDRDDHKDEETDGHGWTDARRLPRRLADKPVLAVDFIAASPRRARATSTLPPATRFGKPAPKRATLRPGRQLDESRRSARRSAARSPDGRDAASAAS